MSTPIRLRIINALFQGERNVGQLLPLIDVAQPNMPQYLNIMCRSGIWSKRRRGAQMFYRIADEKAVVVCRAMCTQVAIDAAVN